MDTIYASKTVSVTELKRNLSGVLASAEGCPVAVLNRNRAEAYLVPAAYYEALMASLEDAEDVRTVKERLNGPFVDVSLDDL